MTTTKTPRRTKVEATPIVHSPAGDPFDLRALVREVLDSTDLESPQEVAAAVIGRIAPENYLVAITTMLPDFARQVIHEHRKPLKAREETPEPEWVDDEADPNLLPKPRVVSHRSRKRDAIRDHIDRWLAGRIHVGSEGWKLRRDLTVDDLMFAAKFRRDQADANLAEALDYEAQAALLTKHSVMTLGQLPQSELVALSKAK